MKNFFKDDDMKQELPEKSLGILAKLANKQEAMESSPDRVDQLYNMIKGYSIPTITEAFARCKEDLRQIQQLDIPELMTELGLSEIKLNNGKKVSVKSGISVTVADKPKFYNWMIQQGWEALVKTTVVVSFPKEGRESSQDFVKYLKQNYANPEKGVGYTEKEEIHPMTLKKHIREERERGTNFPSDLVKIFEYKIAKIGG
jgi:hypothetical protein